MRALPLEQTACTSVLGLNSSWENQHTPDYSYTYQITSADCNLMLRLTYSIRMELSDLVWPLAVTHTSRSNIQLLPPYTSLWPTSASTENKPNIIIQASLAPWPSVEEGVLKSFCLSNTQLSVKALHLRWYWAFSLEVLCLGREGMKVCCSNLASMALCCHLSENQNAFVHEASSTFNQCCCHFNNTKQWCQLTFRNNYCLFLHVCGNNDTILSDLLLFGLLPVVRPINQPCMMQLCY